MAKVLAKKLGKTGELDTITREFTEREWTVEEKDRYELVRGADQLQEDESFLKSK
jgi:hypothetical protein